MIIRRIAGALGAELHGVDLTQDLSDAQQRDIRDALLQNQVIFFRDQDLCAQQFMAFAQTLGQPVEYPFVKGLEGFPVSSRSKNSSMKK